MRNLKRIFMSMIIVMFALSLKVYAFETTIIPAMSKKDEAYGDKYAFKVVFDEEEATGFVESDIQLNRGKVITFNKISNSEYFVVVSKVGEYIEALEFVVPEASARFEGTATNNRAKVTIKLNKDRENPELELAVIFPSDESDNKIQFEVFSRKSEVMIDNGAKLIVSGNGENDTTISLMPRAQDTKFDGKNVGGVYYGEMSMPYEACTLTFKVEAKDMAGNEFKSTPLGISTLNVGGNDLNYSCIKSYEGTKLMLRFEKEIEKIDTSKIIVNGTPLTGSAINDGTNKRYTINLPSALLNTTNVVIKEGAFVSKDGLRNKEKELKLMCASENHDPSKISRDIDDFENVINELKKIEDTTKFIEETTKHINELKIYYLENNANMSVANDKKIKSLSLNILEIIKSRALTTIEVKPEKSRTRVSLDDYNFNNIMTLESKINDLFQNLKIENIELDFEYKINQEFEEMILSFNKNRFEVIKKYKIDFIITNGDVTYYIPHDLYEIKDGDLEIVIKNIRDTENLGEDKVVGKSQILSIKNVFTDDEIYLELKNPIKVEINSSAYAGNSYTRLKGAYVPNKIEHYEFINYDFDIDKNFAKFDVLKSGKYILLCSNEEVKTPEVEKEKEEIKEETKVEINFKDVSVAHWAKTYIDELVRRKITNGLTEDTFGPSELVTRAQAASFLVRARNYNEEPYIDKFIDVPNGKWYTSAVITAANNEIITGYNDGTFKPQGNLTRQEMIAMIMRAYVKDKGITLNDLTKEISQFKDESKISSWAKDAVGAAYSLGIVSGDKNGNFNPLNSITRAEVSKILIEYLKLIEK